MALTDFPPKTIKGDFKLLSRNNSTKEDFSAEIKNTPERRMKPYFLLLRYSNYKLTQNC